MYVEDNIQAQIHTLAVLFEFFTNKDIVILLLSADSDIEYFRRSIQLGVDGSLKTNRYYKESKRGN